MATLGHVKIKDYLKRTKGAVRGGIVTDAKSRIYYEDYVFEENGDGLIAVSCKDGHGDTVILDPVIELDEGLIAFWGLYSGDGAKGTEDPSNPNVLKPVISFSQKEPIIVRFAFEQFRKFFSDNIRFSFQLGEDSAFFMAGTGLEILKEYCGGSIPATPPLHKVRQTLNDADLRYLEEKRFVKGTNKQHLAFYYFHKDAMQEILTAVKLDDIKRSGIELCEEDKVGASLRRPFKKGAREPGGTSRSDEMHVGGLNGFGQLFLKILHEMEESIYHDKELSTQGLIHWNGKPSEIGVQIDIRKFFQSHLYGSIGGERPELLEEACFLRGRWPRSKFVHLNRALNIDPLFCYVAGLYLAEGSTPKSKMFSMFKNRPSGLSLSFTSSENVSIDLVLRSLKKLFPKDDCINTWKIKVGSQYFPELVVIGLKNGVPMLRGGNSGDGKLRTMEISLALKPWALGVVPSLLPYEEKYSHVEPTGAGLARIDFSASSSLCKWYFPLLVYSIFGNYVSEPSEGFIND